MTKKHGISKRQHIRACRLHAAMLLTVVAAGCSRKPSKPVGNLTAAPTEAVKPTEAATTMPEPTATSKPTTKPMKAATPSSTPTAAPTPMPSGTGGRVTFSGNSVALSEAKVGDTVHYGSYEQDNNLSNGAEAIEWLVLDKQDGKLLLLSKDELDAKPYNETDVNVTWGTCTLRNWLNGEFYHTAFSQTEQGCILTAKVKNEDNPKYGTEGGNDTKDKLFLLSIGEVLNYFAPDYNVYAPARRAKVTAYAKAQGAYVSSDSGYAGNGWWWLRSPGGSDDCAAGVYHDGTLGMGGVVGRGCGGVRPVFWLNLESTE